MNDEVNCSMSLSLSRKNEDEMFLGASGCVRLKGEHMNRLHGTTIRHVGSFKQIEGVDFNETFDSVVKPMSFKTIYAIAPA